MTFGSTLPEQQISGSFGEPCLSQEVPGLLVPQKQLSAPLRRLRQVRSTRLLARRMPVHRLREFHLLVQRVRSGGGPEENQHPDIDHVEGLAPCQGERLLRGAVSFCGEPVAPRLNTPPVAPRLQKEKGLRFLFVFWHAAAPVCLQVRVCVRQCFTPEKHSHIRDSACGRFWVYVFVNMSYVSV